MKGQFIFEFLIAGLIFFTIIVYTINYLNVNVSDFKSKFYQSRLQSKAIQISEVLMSSESSLGLVDDSGFSLTKIQDFNNTYCEIPFNATKYKGKLIRDFYLYEKVIYSPDEGFPNDVKIILNSASGEMLLDCGLRIPRNTAKAEIGRVGTLNREIAKLKVVVW